MRYRGRNRLPRWVVLIVAVVIALPLVAVSANQQERFASLTIEQLLGIRVDAESPPSGLPLPRSGLVLGLGANLTLLGGDLSVRAFPRSPSVTVTGTTLLTTGPVRSLCYIITAYIDDQEFLFWRDALLAVLGSDGRWSIQLEWATVPELTHLVRFGMRTGFRVYRRFVPANELGVVCQTVFSDLRLVEEFPSDPSQSTVVFTDGGTSSGKPAIGPPGPLSLASTPGNLAVDNVASLGALQVGSVGAPALGNAAIQSNLAVGNNARVANNLGVGTAAPAGGPGDARINNSLSVGAVSPPGGAGDGQFAGNVGIGGAPTLPARLNIVDPLGANIYLDATATPSVMNFGGQVWEIISTGTGAFAINSLSTPVGGSCCPPPLGPGLVPGNPRFVIDSQGRAGMGCTPAGPAGAGSLQLAKSLGVGMAAPNACGGINACGPVNIGGAVAVGGGLGVGVAAPEGFGNADIGNDLFVMNDAGIGNDLGVIRDAGIGNDLVVGNDAGIARDLNVGRDANVLNDLVVANNADVLNDLSVLNDAEVFGDLTVWGRKFFAQPHPTDPTKVITYAALEGPEAGTYVRGTAQLVDGEVTIELPESFRLVTGEDGLTVQVTPSEECNGLYVVEKDQERIVVKELMSGSSNAQFDYLVQGIRKGYEDFEPIRAGDRNES